MTSGESPFKKAKTEPESSCNKGSAFLINEAFKALEILKFETLISGFPESSEEQKHCLEFILQCS